MFAWHDICFSRLVEVGFSSNLCDPSLPHLPVTRWMNLSPTSRVLLESIAFHELNFSQMVKKVVVMGREEEDGIEVGQSHILLSCLSLCCLR